MAQLAKLAADRKLRAADAVTLNDEYPFSHEATDQVARHNAAYRMRGAEHRVLCRLPEAQSSANGGAS